MFPQPFIKSEGFITITSPVVAKMTFFLPQDFSTLQPGKKLGSAEL